MYTCLTRKRETGRDREREREKEMDQRGLFLMTCKGKKQVSGFLGLGSHP